MTQYWYYSTWAHPCGHQDRTLWSPATGRSKKKGAPSKLGSFRNDQKDQSRSVRANRRSGAGAGRRRKKLEDTWESVGFTIFALHVGPQEFLYVVAGQSQMGRSPCFSEPKGRYSFVPTAESDSFKMKARDCCLNVGPLFPNTYMWHQLLMKKKL